MNALPTPDQRKHHRGTHAGNFRQFFRELADLLVQPHHRLPDRRNVTVSHGWRLVFHDLFEHIGEHFHDQASRHVSGIHATHAVGYNEQAPLRQDCNRILIVCAHVAQIRQACNPENAVHFTDFAAVFLQQLLEKCDQ